MTEYRVTTYNGDQVVMDQVVTGPELDGVAARGFVLADDRSWCIVVDPVPKSVGGQGD